MRRNRLLVVLAVLLGAASLALVKGPTFLSVIVAPTSSAVSEKFYAAKTSGTGTADTVFVWRGSVRGLTDDATVVVASGLDTTLVYKLTATFATTALTQYGTVQYSTFYQTIAAVQDIDGCPAVCNAVLSDCAGTTGTDAKFNTCLYASGANGVVEFENRLGATVQVTWELTGGS